MLQKGLQAGLDSAASAAHQQHQQQQCISSNSASEASAFQQHQQNRRHISLYTLTPPEMPKTPPDMHNRACCHEVIFSKILAWVFFWCLFMFRIGTKNLKNLSLIFHEWKLVLVLGVFTL